MVLAILPVIKSRAARRFDLRRTSMSQPRPSGASRAKLRVAIIVALPVAFVFGWFLAGLDVSQPVAMAICAVPLAVFVAWYVRERLKLRDTRK
ncbi:hypothetical protein [Dactylosporangium sp. CA-233914]|uniref:hypothetical protein n=1 Tax=Dactylosporangium sp. CA-233914 TaxID=3239934 RepID=UPI003D93F40A